MALAKLAVVVLGIAAMLPLAASVRGGKAHVLSKHHAACQELSRVDYETMFSAGLTSPLLLEFYSPTCPHCIDFAPTYEEVAVSLQKSGIRVARIDGTSNGDLCQQYGITAYPTVRFFPRGYKFDLAFLGTTFSEERTAAAVQSWAKELSKKSQEELQHAHIVFRRMGHVPPTCPRE